MSKHDQAPVDVAFDEGRMQFSTVILREHLRRWDDLPLVVYESALSARIAGEDVPPFERCERLTDDLRMTWAAMQRDTSVDEVRCVIAQAHLTLPGVGLEFDPSNGQVVLLTLPGAEAMSNWRVTVLEAQINQAIARHEMNGFIHPSQLRTLFLRSVFYGESVEREPVAIRMRPDRVGFTGPYNLVVDIQRLSLDLYIGDILAAATPSNRQKIDAEIEEGLWRLTLCPGASPVRRSMTAELSGALERAHKGPQRLGLQMPLIVPAGFILREETQGTHLGDPTALLSLINLQESRMPKRAAELLRKRGLIKSGQLNPRSRVTPIVALDTASPETRGKYFGIAGRGREALRPSDRELQVLTLPVSAESATYYTDEMDRFWRGVVDDFAARTPSPDDVDLIAWSYWVPLTLPLAEKKARTEVTGIKPSDGAVWLPLVVREVLALEAISTTPGGIASCLVPEVSEGAVELALKGLVASGMVIFDGHARRYAQNTRNIMTEDDMPGDKVARLHAEMSLLAEQRLLRNPDGCRARAVVVRISPEGFQELKQRLRTKTINMLTKNGSDRRPEFIAALGVQMFLSKVRPASPSA